MIVYHHPTPQSYNLPGLHRECKDFSKQLKIENAFLDTKIPKLKFKGIVKRAIAIENKNEIKSMMTKSKCEDILSENFGLKQYFKDLTVTEARIKFRIKTKMIHAKLNFQNDRRNSRLNWICESCDNSCIETQSHIMWCEAYSHLRDGLDMKSDRDIVKYFAQVATIRQELQLIR